MTEETKSEDLEQESTDLITAPEDDLTDEAMEASSADDPSEPQAADPAEPWDKEMTAEEREACGPDDPRVMKASIIDGIKAIYDPEIPVNIWDLGLIYKVVVQDDKTVDIDMTLTSPMCPTAQMLVGSVELAAKDVPHVVDARVELVWEPPWDMEKMSDEAKMLLGF